MTRSPRAVRALVTTLAALLTATAAAAPARATPEPKAPRDFVALHSVDPTILHEIRYVTPHNFVGERIDGYRQPLCILTRPAAEALRTAQRRLLPQGYSLKVYDCYRPQRANRTLLKNTLEDLGFVNLAEEWWHYTFKPEAYPDTYFDFPVSQRSVAGHR
ncbi:M15 family metallopeptidase [Streptomyces sp. EMB24]|uniref:M15 family metallopeptidase n=1 Tax=Streptomyces sp. EMB24 TaxID=2835531 RepID=UPI00227BC70F|nr:M15 family metallopeptidase [Streptomyces sp. EMB24]